MSRYVIERDIPQAGKLNHDQLRDASRKSCDVLRSLGNDIQWLESYVTDDKIYCVYDASDEALIHRHAKESGFPATRISRIRNMISPLTVEA
jgi:hypothetical protein